MTQASDRLLWLINHAGKFPRSHRFVMGERTEPAMLTGLMQLGEVAYSRENLPLFQRANLEWEKLRMVNRLGKDVGFPSLAQYEHALQALLRLGQQIGSWITHQRRL